MSWKLLLMDLYVIKLHKVLTRHKKMKEKFFKNLRQKLIKNSSGRSLMTSWISLHIMHTMLFVESLSHHQGDSFSFSPAAVFSLDYVQVDKKKRKLWKWKLKNFIKLVSAINYKIYVFKGLLFFRVKLASLKMLLKYYCRKL